MSHKTDLQSNNVDLQSILATINALPEAGGGGGADVETVNVRCTVATMMGDRVDFILMYTACENGEVRSHIITQSEVEYDNAGSVFFTIENVVLGTTFWVSTSWVIMEAYGRGAEMVLSDGMGYYAGFMVNNAFENDDFDNTAFIYITCFD